MRAAGTLVEQQSARMSRAVQGVGASVERINRAASSVNPNAFRALAVSALRAEDNVKRLEAAMVAVSALAGGFVGALVVRSLVQAADEYRNIQNRIATVVSNENQRVAVNQRIFEIAQASRTEYSATASLFSRISAATDRLGVSSADVLTVVEAIQKSFALFGSSTAEAQSAAIQLAQGLASGRLQGDELKSILENNIPLAKILARELAGDPCRHAAVLGHEMRHVEVHAAFLRDAAVAGVARCAEATVTVGWVGVAQAGPPREGAAQGLDPQAHGAELGAQLLAGGAQGGLAGVSGAQIQEELAALREIAQHQQVAVHCGACAVRARAITVDNRGAAAALTIDNRAAQRAGAVLDLVEQVLHHHHRAIDDQAEVDGPQAHQVAGDAQRHHACQRAQHGERDHQRHDQPGAQRP